MRIPEDASDLDPVVADFHADCDQTGGLEQLRWASRSSRRLDWEQGFRR